MEFADRPVSHTRQNEQARNRMHIDIRQCGIKRRKQKDIKTQAGDQRIQFAQID